MSKIRVTSVNGPAQDVSFQGTDQQTGAAKTVPAFSIPCSGTVDGNEMDFNIKVYSQRNVPFIKPGFAPSVDVAGSEYQGVWTYSCKKDCFPQQQQQGGGKWGGKPFVPKDVEREEAAKFPSFSRSYAKDVLIALIAKGQVNADSVSTTWDLLSAHSLAWLRANAAKAPAKSAQSAPAGQAGQLAKPAGQQQDITTKLWAKLQNAGVKEEAQQAGVTVNMLKEWWGETQQNDLLFIKRVRKELSAATSQEEPPPPADEGESNDLPF